MIEEMRFFKLFLLGIVLLAIVGGGVMWFMAGREAGPTITIHSPEKYIGRSTPLAVSIESPDGDWPEPSSASSRTARPSRCRT